MGIKTGRTGQADLHPSLGEETGSRIASHKVVKELVKDVGGHRLASTPTGPTLAGPAHWAHACAAAKATGSDLDKAPLQGPKRQGKKKKNHIVQERNDRNDAFRQMVKVGSYVEVHLPATGQDPGSCVEVQDTDDWWDAQVLKVCLDDGRDGWVEVLL